MVQDSHLSTINKLRKLSKYFRVHIVSFKGVLRMKVAQFFLATSSNCFNQSVKLCRAHPFKLLHDFDHFLFFQSILYRSAPSPSICPCSIHSIRLIHGHSFHFTVYQARGARRACALRALGLLLADGAPTVGGGKTF